MSGVHLTSINHQIASISSRLRAHSTLAE